MQVGNGRGRIDRNRGMCAKIGVLDQFSILN